MSIWDFKRGSPSYPERGTYAAKTKLGTEVIDEAKLLELLGSAGASAPAPEAAPAPETKPTSPVQGELF